MQLSMVIEGYTLRCCRPQPEFKVNLSNLVKLSQKESKKVSLGICNSVDERLPGVRETLGSTPGAKEWEAGECLWSLDSLYFSQGPLNSAVGYNGAMA